MIRRILLVLAATIAAALATAPGASAVFIGIGDQKPAMFTDPLFRSLEIRKARLVVPWDVMTVRWQRAEVDAWMDAAQAAGVRPLVALGRSRRPGRERVLPTAATVRSQFVRLHRRYRWVKEWSAWNEANHCSQPTCRRPEMVARYYDVMRRVCRSCTVIAAEVLDQPNMVAYVRAVRRAAKVPPKVWALHNYLDANRLRTSGTRALLRVTRGEVWFTETGGIVWRKRRGRIAGFPETPSHAAVATRWLFDKLVPLSPRITRVYLYHWDLGGPRDKWDSALLTPHGTPRPAFAVLQREVRKEARAREGRRARARAAG